MNRTRTAFITAATLALVTVYCNQGFAASLAGVALPSAGGPLPWDRVLGMVANALTGTTAKLLALIAIAICGIGWMFSEGGSGMRKLFAVGIGISLVFGASSLVSMMFSGGSGLTI